MKCSHKMSHRQQQNKNDYPFSFKSFKFQHEQHFFFYLPKLLCSLIKNGLFHIVHWKIKFLIYLFFHLLYLLRCYFIESCRVTSSRFSIYFNWDWMQYEPRKYILRFFFFFSQRYIMILTLFSERLKKKKYLL